MYKLTIEDSFAAAHYLKNYEGPCARVHGHTWRVQARIKGTNLDRTGILVDFKVLKKSLKAVLDKFDHQCINEIPPFDKINPTAENLSKYIWKSLWKDDTLPARSVVWVRVWESLTAYCEYSDNIVHAM